jgi:hypothetical protein
MRPNKFAVRVSCTTLTGADLTGTDLRGGVLRTSDDRLLPLPIERCRRIRDPLRGYSWGALIALPHRMSPHLAHSGRHARRPRRPCFWSRPAAKAIPLSAQAEGGCQGAGAQAKVAHSSINSRRAGNRSLRSYAARTASASLCAKA